jgi:uroporphyrinogen-III synthase
MANVLLLREPSIDAPDRYEAAFHEAGYHPISIPVLETVHDNISGLGDIIKNGPSSQSFRGVIITSKRSCDAWRGALELLKESDINKTEKKGAAGWSHVPFYVVGQTTATALRDIFTEFADLGLESVDILGQDSGSAASLAPFILEDIKERPAKLLYLTGDKNRDTISRLLNEGGIALEPLRVYKTHGSPDFEDNLASTLASSPHDLNEWWIIYFAPSAATFVTPILRKHFRLEGSSSDTTSNTSSLLHAKVAAIGPTTNAFLQDELHLRVHAMAQKPTPEDIVSVIMNQDGLNE